MQAEIHKSQVSGRASAPPSKSYTIRGLICSALAQGTSSIINPLESEDTEAARDVLKKMGVAIAQEGACWEVKGGNLRPPTDDLFCRDSAATLRFMTAICATIQGRCRLTAGPSLSQRPVKALAEALEQLGVTCISNDGMPPLTVEGGTLKGEEVEMGGEISQYISALLFIAPLMPNGLRIRLNTPPKSRPYLMMTLECLERFRVGTSHSTDMREFRVPRQRYTPTAYDVEGDWSSASYLLALGVLGGEVAVENLNLQSRQGDRALLGHLIEMGAGVDIEGEAVVVRKANLKALQADLSQCIDLLPTIAMLCAAAEGESRLTGIAGARIKESDRVGAVREGLKRMGVKVEENEDSLVITGSPLKGAVIDSRKDHRIAMAFAVLGTAVGGTTIENAECVSKTFPQFWDILRDMGGKIDTNG